MRRSLTIACYLLLGLTSLFGQTEGKLIVEFSEIDSSQYVEYKGNYSNELIVDSTKETIPDSSFALKIQNKEQRFDCNMDHGLCYYYRGFLLPVNSFVITQCGRLVCQTFLIDKTSGERHYLVSPYDNQCEVPVLSKDLNKMLVYASNVFDRESFISVYRRGDKKEDFNFEDFDGLTTNKWRIYEAIWIDDTAFALTTFDRYGGKTGNEPLNIKYVKGEINTIANKK